MSPNLAEIRRQFPGLARSVNGQPAAFFDGPAGSQVPQQVIDAVADYYVRCNANHGGDFATSRESDEVLAEAHRAVADLLGSDDPACVSFGPNMTTLTLSLSRALARTWIPGDEIIVTRLDHDANVTPWVLAARDQGVIVHHIPFDPSSCTLELSELSSRLGSRTRLVAVGCASNAVGTINPIEKIVEMAHAVGALVFLDAVHYAPHRAMDVAGWDCDFLACSAYKFFGPHLGILWGRRTILEELQYYKLRPAPNELPDKLMTGTQNHEGIAGTRAAIDYLASVGRAVDPEGNRRSNLIAAYRWIQKHEDELGRHLLAGLLELDGIQVFGITDPGELEHRTPTFSWVHQRVSPQQVATALGAEGIFVWAGNHYALPFTEAMNLEPEGTVRAGLLHYNTSEEVDRLLQALRRL